MKRLMLVLMLVCGSVMAIDDDNLYIMKGMGTHSCNQVMSNYNDKDEWDRSTQFQYGRWVNGYLTAYNFLRKGKHDWADKPYGTDYILYGAVIFCSTNPTGSNAVGASHTFNFTDAVHYVMKKNIDPTFGTKFIE